MVPRLSIIDLVNGRVEKALMETFFILNSDRARSFIFFIAPFGACVTNLAGNHKFTIKANYL
jgi:hypothetical protein